MISLYELLQASRGQLLGQPGSQIFEGFCWDQRQAAPHRLFVALEPEYGDTHILIPDAIANGVSGILCSSPPECNTDGVSVILVSDTIEALYAWCHFVVGRRGVKVVGVLGSPGQTAAIDAISYVLATQFLVHSSAPNIPDLLAIPVALANLTYQHRFVVVAINSEHPGMITRAVQALQPEAIVVMGTAEHSYGIVEGDSFEQVTRVLENLSPNGLAVLNGDDDMLKELTQSTRAAVSTVGLQRFGADLMAADLVNGRNGLWFDVRQGYRKIGGQQFELLGAYHVYSALSALAVGVFYDIDIEDGMKALKKVTPCPGRLSSSVAVEGWTLVDDSRGDGQPSLEGALDWFREILLEEGRRLLVLGDWKIDAPNTIVDLSRLGAELRQSVDMLVAIGGEATSVAIQAMAQGLETEKIHIVYTFEDAWQIIQEQFKPQEDDVLLLHGRQDENIQKLVMTLQDDDAGTTHSSNPFVVGHGHLSWLELDYGALANNARLLKANAGDKVELMAVVKADGYGHGAVASAWTALNNGASWIGVSSVPEAIVLREQGITSPILVLNLTNIESVKDAIQHKLSLTLFDLDLARIYSRIATHIDGAIPVHIKVDSGMGRLGILPEQLAEFYRRLVALPGLEIEGIYTHFSTADEDAEYLEHQLNVFQTAVRRIQGQFGVKIPLIHAANSAAQLRSIESHLNMVRAGIALYGLNPSPELSLSSDFLPVMSWKTRIAQVKTLPAGHPIGYGNTYVTERPERIAIIPIGYGDGFRRGPNDWGYVLVRGQRAPIIGRVSMEKVVIQVEDIPGVRVGDEVVLLGQQGDERIIAEDVAERLGTINYEVTTNILARMPRLG